MSSLLPNPDLSLSQLEPSLAVAKVNKIVAPILPLAAYHVERVLIQSSHLLSGTYVINKAAAQYRVTSYFKRKTPTYSFKINNRSQIEEPQYIRVKKAPLHAPYVRNQ